jgi:ABC-type lipoprotein export system ATPase subunit
MHITRVQVEEGFLDGLDLQLRAGLVTLIGARGTGKTSLIELVRFCLDVPGYTQDSTRRSRDHALSVLGSGQITVKMADGGREVTVTRTAVEETPRKSAQFASPIILSQTEIENVGMQSGGRLRLLDGFRDDRASGDRDEAAAAAEVRSLTLEAASIRKEIEDLERRYAELPAIETSLAELAPQEEALAGISAESNKKSAELAVIVTQTSAAGVTREAIAIYKARVKEMGIALAHASGPLDERWPDGVTERLNVPLTRLSEARGHITRAIAELADGDAEADKINEELLSKNLVLEERAREIRKEIERLQVGAGATMRQGQQLRERKAQLDAVSGTMEGRRAALDALRARRNQSLDRLDQIRSERFAARMAIVRSLNDAVGPRIRLHLLRSGQVEGFSAILADKLRGSGLRYNELADVLAKSMSPRELLDAVETNDIQLISDAAKISSDRALKIINGLKDADLGTIGTSLVEDDVCFELLDGGDYKDISDLSTGQRCTVILPVVLQHRDRLLIVDQPEDHIDNAFIADTLIKSILQRAQDGQIVFSTHNPNIPVLGAADMVVHLESDGRRGFVASAAPLDDPTTVNAITTVMEGGEEAFRRRAEFYQQHQAS